ncbi:ATP-dependent DNA helicase RecG [Sphingomicrobium astaxanthinifaciens]|uniref:ATP-dependent DNA helicase RecG n=1 Tax=Sphingomicrobium astaxanthinifaciens TaxID=1227949 RepID=UPI001FCC49B7|nr:ATP-dependent DNA helicase RecG [Sphingomicrobium astaxanthinifaciens]MCJ7422310.1 ATP-dependent DNA helicase RecG [Sphingomicrobium astaxanthinifaciens]
MRPEVLQPLFAETIALDGVGPKIARALGRLKLERSVDLAFHLPSGTLERVATDRLGHDLVGRRIVITLTPMDLREGRGRAPLRIFAADRQGNMVGLTFFNNPGWAKKQFPLGEPVRITGKLDAYGEELQIVHPEKVDEDPPLSEPVYPLSEGLTNKRMRELVRQVLERAPELPEWIEPSVKAERDFADWRSALAAAHRDPKEERARARLAYDEIFANQLTLLLVRQSARRRATRPLEGDGSLSARLKLPFALTNAQARCVGEIRGDMAQERPMLRLLQGDVGSGKTLVALLAMLEAVEAGAQAAMLAPTEILARQHYEGLRRLAEPIGVRVAILTGRDKGRVRESTLMGLADGSIHILVGTHAIFQQAVTYHDLGLVVVDEQHRFGVSQRLMLSEKGKRPPHLLAMTATPIPRTLTLTQYGEMDVSRIDELPPGRQPIETLVIAEEKIGDVVAGLGRHIDAGGQAYWVCPLVEESDKSDAAAAEDRAAALMARFPGRVGLVHGRMKGEEKDAVMERFARGELSVLVATTVIEVGVDVPNATLMIIEGAERFGLAQLHQLRGRVGRGSGKSRCLLLRGGNLSETGRARLALMRETNDGFRIAEEDLRLRGPGEILGTRQSGDHVFKLAEAEDIAALAPGAQADAQLLLDRDGGLEGPRGQAARTCLYLFERDAAVGLLKGG